MTDVKTVSDNGLIKTEQLLKWRSIWMAIAILMIVFFHSDLKSNLFLIKALRQYGYGGVDIFMFASGIGCFASYTRDRNFARFLQGRARRILPVYWFVLLIWIAQKTLLCKERIYPSQIIGDFFCVQNFTGNGNDFNWYISAIWLFYILTPLLVLLTEHVTAGTKYRHIRLLAASLLFTVSFWNSPVYIITIVRIPTFLLGMIAMLKAKEGCVLNKRRIILMLGIMAAGCSALFFCNRYFPEYMWSKGLYWYPFLLITPGLCFIISITAEFLSRFRTGKWLLARLNCLGQITFETFIAQITIYYSLDYLIRVGRIPDNNLIWYLAITASIISGLLLGKVRKAADKYILSKYKGSD